MGVQPSLSTPGQTGIGRTRLSKMDAVAVVDALRPIDAHRRDAQLSQPPVALLDPAPPVERRLRPGAAGRAGTLRWTPPPWRGGRQVPDDPAIAV